MNIQKNAMDSLPLRIVILLACCISCSVLGQNEATAAGSGHGAGVSAQATPESSSSLSPFISALLPMQDTNAAVGISYPAGSSDFVYLVAGRRPPGGDPRLPPVPDTAVTNEAIVEFSTPLVIFERTPYGSGAVATREVVGERRYDFPPGAVIRGLKLANTAARPGGSPAAGRGPIVVLPERAVDENGQDIVQEFPPGARLVRVVASPRGGD